MAESCWTVGLISTDYDLHAERQAVAEHLESFGFKIIAFEKPDFAVEPHMHSHDACLKALEVSDIIVVIINKRYGGLYLGLDGASSITEQEYDAAVSKSKPIVCCVHKHAWDERHDLQKLAKDKGLTVEEAYCIQPPKYVDKWEVVGFIDKIHRSTTDNFIRYYETTAELIEHVHGHMIGLSRYQLEMIIRTQIDEVKGTKTTTGMALSFGDVIDRGYFIEPPYRMVCGSGEHGSTALQIISLLQTQNTGFALLGGAGGGKSTLIARAFLDHAEVCIKEKTSRMPFFVSLRGKGLEYHFSFLEYVRESFENLLGKPVYPALSLSSIAQVLYMDGFDELTEDIANIDQQRIASSEFFNASFILSCRSRFATDYDITLGSKFPNIMELMPWGIGLAEEYVDHFCEARNRDELKVEIKNAFSSSKEMIEIAANPLLLTLFLWVVEEGEMTLPLDVISRITLYDKCLELWARRDLARIGIDGTHKGRVTQALLIRAWQLGAWEVYRYRFGVSDRLYLPGLLSRIAELDPEVASTCKQEAFSSLFDINRITNSVVGMIHEQLLEHLVAQVIFYGMLDEKIPFPESLNYLIRPEINRNIRSIWESFDHDTQDRILEHLWHAYIHALDDEANITLRNQATYYMGRIPTDEAVRKLEYAKKLEKNLFVKASIEFGLVKRLCFDAEREFLDMLKCNDELDSANRGYHLFYYRDWQIKDGKPPYLDPCNVPWNKTLMALLRHLESHSAKHVALRRIELFTIKRFINTRNSRGNLTDQIMDKIRNEANSDVYHDGHFPKEFCELVMQEYHELYEVWAQTPV